MSALAATRYAIEPSLIRHPLARISIAGANFGVNFPLSVEPYAHHQASLLCPLYQESYWDFFTLDNGGFFMSLSEQVMLEIRCPNHFCAKVNGETFGIIVCIYMYARLSESRNPRLAQACQRHHELLTKYAAQRADAGLIFAATR